MWLSFYMFGNNICLFFIFSACVFFTIKNYKCFIKYNYLNIHFSFSFFFSFFFGDWVSQAGLRRAEIINMTHNTWFNLLFSMLQMIGFFKNP